MSPRSTTARWAAALPVAAALLLSAAASPAMADDSTYNVELRQDLPRTSTTNDDGAPQQSPDQCPGIPEGMDGWHFVLPGNQTHFVKLTVTFEPGGEQVLTEFGPPSDKHAYVASAPGAELTSVTAEVEGGELELFNLSHTCPSDTAPKPGESPSDEPSEQPTTPGATDAPSDAPSASAPDEAAASPSPNGGNDGDLAETGSGTPVAALTAGAAALLGAGGYLVLRRRRAAAQQD